LPLYYTLLMLQKVNTQYIFGCYVVLALATFFAFEPVRHNQFVRYDDYTYVVENSYVTSGITTKSVIWAFTAGYACNWHPLTWLSHMLDYEFFGLNPPGHHLTNLFFHIVNSLLLLWILKRATGALWPSFFVAAVFALHPSRVESVAWVAERKDVLSGFFWMLTIAAYVQYAQKPALIKYLLVVLTFSLGLMAKPMLVTLPFVLLLLDYWPLGRFQWKYRDIKPAMRLVFEKVPLFVLAAVSCTVTYLVQRSAGVMEFGRAISLNDRVCNALTVYIRYIGKMIYPVRLAVLYPWSPNMSLWYVMLCSVVLLGISAVAVWKIKKYPFVAVGWFWYIGTLIPVIGLVQVGGQAMADRYTYLPSVGILIVFAWSVCEFVKKLRFRKVELITISVFLVCSALLLVTRRQVRYWRDSITLFERTLAVTENNFVIHNNLGNELLDTGDLDGAIRHYTEALEINPQYPSALKNIGMVFVKKGDFDKAVDYFTRASLIRPGWADVYNSLGLAYAQQNKHEPAMRNFEHALSLKPDYPNVYYNMGFALVRQQQYDDAVERFKKALKLRPDWAEAHLKLGSAYYKLGKTVPAIEQLRKVAAIYAEKGRFDNALEAAEKALELAISAGQKELADKIQSELRLYTK